MGLLHSRGLYLFTALWAAAIVWLAPHPPMIDLPQHAGQLALLKQLLAGDTRWATLFQINPYTPYLIGFGLALPLSYLMSIAAAMKMLLSLAYLAFVYLCVMLRRHFGADARLDWLFLTSFFGFAFHWGFFTFLTAAPLGLWFVLLADRYAQAPTSRRGSGVAVLGLVLLVSHGLVFLFALGVATALLAMRCGSVRSLLKTVWPLAIVTAACGAYFVARGPAEAAFQVAPTVPAVMWQWGIRHEVLYYAFGLTWTPFYTLAGLVLLAAPWFLGLRIDLRNRPVLAPFAVLSLILAFAPSFVFETSFVYQRFALFLFPAYAWMFKAAPEAAAQPTLPRAAALPALMLICWAVLGLNTWRHWQFGREAADFERISAGLAPGQRALALIFDPASAASGDRGTYGHYASWYQAERQGLVDFNFAWVQPQIVRYRVATRPTVMMDFAWGPQKFRWAQHGGDSYRYFIVRHREPLPAALFQGAPCAPLLVQASGSWKVYERQACPAPTGYPDSPAGARSNSG